MTALYRINGKSDADHASRFDWAAHNANLDARMIALKASLVELDQAEQDTAASAIAVSRAIRGAIEGAQA